MSDEARLEANKELVRRLIDGLFYGDGTGIDQTIDEVVGAEYIQHNPLAGAGRDDLKKFVHQLVPLPEHIDRSKVLEVNYLAEGDRVMRQELSTHGMLIDVFRVEDGKLVEHWDAYRPNPGYGPLMPGF